MKQIYFLFGMQERVTRKAYVLWGLSLMFLKYLGEVLLYYVATDEFFSPLRFLSPLIYYRYPGFTTMPDWFGPGIVVWSLAFIWIGTGMSIRRAADANLSPWYGILFFVPGVNFILMLALSILPSSAIQNWAYHQKTIQNKKLIPPVILTFIFAFVGALVAWISTNLFKVYGASLFYGSPLVLGLVMGYYLNFKSRQSFKITLGYTLFTVFLIHLLLLLFALEGLICLAMSLPISAVLASIGALFGMAIGSYSKPNSLTPVAFIFLLPLMPVVESQISKTHQDMVLSTVEINTSPEKVWPNVVKFSDLPKNEDWLFKLGVAHPLRARIDGEGVGAVRHCEFSTGAFVEPITVWNEPYQLGFDVRYQPQPLKEVSFYDHIDAPHLNAYFRSVKGEFRLIKTESGKTILEGRTWYEMDMHPGWYWQIYGRWFIHKIHLRVLDHIKNLSEG